MMEAARKQAAKRGLLGILEELYKPEYGFLRQGEVSRMWNDLLLHGKDSDPEFTAWRNTVSLEMVPRAAQTILEVGVGSGRAVEYLTKHLPAAALYGIDVSQEVVASIAGRFKGRFAAADIESVPWPGVRFDVILMLEVLEHVEVTRTFRVLRAVRGLLADDRVFGPFSAAGDR